jgi:hypothetical protein
VQSLHSAAQSAAIALRNRFIQSASKTLCNRCAICCATYRTHAVQSLHSAAQSAAIALRNRFTICCENAVQSLRNLLRNLPHTRCAIAAQSLHNRCAVARQTLHNSCAIAAKALCNHYIALPLQPMSLFVNSKLFTTGCKFSWWVTFFGPRVLVGASACGCCDVE